ncbi:1310_t:CDS:2, partial [Dentiscutata erythropus]
IKKKAIKITTKPDELDNVIESPSSPMPIAVSEDITNKDELSSNVEPEVIVDYKLFIKIANGVLLP